MEYIEEEIKVKKNFEDEAVKVEVKDEIKEESMEVLRKEITKKKISITRDSGLDDKIKIKCEDEEFKVEVKDEDVSNEIKEEEYIEMEIEDDKIKIKFEDEEIKVEVKDEDVSNEIKEETEEEYIEKEIKDEYSSGEEKRKFLDEDIKVEGKCEDIVDEIKEEMEEVDVKVEIKKEREEKSKDEYSSGKVKRKFEDEDGKVEVKEEYVDEKIDEVDVKVKKENMKTKSSDKDSKVGKEIKKEIEEEYLSRNKKRKKSDDDVKVEVKDEYIEEEIKKEFEITELRESLKCKFLEKCTPLFCSTCQQTFASQDISNDHYAGEPHQRLLQSKLKAMLKKYATKQEHRSTTSNCESERKLILVNVRNIGPCVLCPVCNPSGRSESDMVKVSNFPRHVKKVHGSTVVQKLDSEEGALGCHLCGEKVLLKNIRMDTIHKECVVDYFQYKAKGDIDHNILEHACECEKPNCRQQGCQNAKMYLSRLCT